MHLKEISGTLLLVSQVIGTNSEIAVGAASIAWSLRKLALCFVLAQVRSRSLSHRFYLPF
jgi:hypothetical protein